MTQAATMTEQVARTQFEVAKRLSDAPERTWEELDEEARSGLLEMAEAAIAALQGSAALPIPMLLYCPSCGSQHLDEPDERTPDWTNPPHRSHLCHDCGCIWRPADVPTTGVAAIETQGKADTWTAERGNAESAMRATTPTAPVPSEATKRMAKTLGCEFVSNGAAPVQDDDAVKTLQEQVDDLQMVIDRMGAALDRLGSMEAFVVPRVIDHDNDAELLARCNFARATAVRS